MSIQSSSKEWTQDCVNSHPATRGSQEAGFTQPRDPFSRALYWLFGLETNELYPKAHLVMVLFELKTRLNCVNLLPCRPTPFKLSDVAVVSVLRFSRIANNDSSGMTLSDRSTELEAVPSIDASRSAEKWEETSRRC